MNPINQGNENYSDHDLLIDLRAEVRGIRSDIKTINDDSGAKLSDHELRLRLIERYMWLAIGGLYIINLALGLYILTKHS